MAGPIPEDKLKTANDMLRQVVNNNVGLDEGKLSRAYNPMPIPRDEEGRMNVLKNIRRDREMLEAYSPRDPLLKQYAGVYHDFEARLAKGWGIELADLPKAANPLTDAQKKRDVNNPFARTLQDIEEDEKKAKAEFGRGPQGYKLDPFIDQGKFTPQHDEKKLPLKDNTAAFEGNVLGLPNHVVAHKAALDASIAEAADALRQLDANEDKTISRDEVRNAKGNNKRWEQIKTSLDAISKDGVISREDLSMALIALSSEPSTTANGGYPSDDRHKYNIESPRELLGALNTPVPNKVQEQKPDQVKR